MTWDPRKLRAAGIEPRHLAALLGIHKITASNWLCGHRVPNDTAAANSLMDAVDSALADRALPVADPEMPREERWVRTRDTLRRYYQAAQEGAPT